MITENGAVFPEPLHDERRVRFVHDHVAALHDAIEQGVPVIGYCHWSLLDNFEWAEGFARRFGIVYVDYATQERIPKASFRWYRDLIASGRLPQLEPAG
jgi:beta-glucosidase